MKIPLCKDCQHYMESSGASLDRCAKRFIGRLDLVRGPSLEAHGLCESTRASETQCGEAGKWFQLKQAIAA